MLEPSAFHCTILRSSCWVSRRPLRTNTLLFFWISHHISASWTLGNVFGFIFSTDNGSVILFLKRDFLFQRYILRYLSLCGGGVSLVPLQWHWVRPLGLKSSLCYFLAVNVFGQVTQGLSFLILKMGVYLGTGHWVWHRVLATIIMWRLPLPLQLVPSGFWGFIFWGQRTRLSGRAAALLCLWFFDHSWIS